MLLYVCITHGCVHAVRELTSRDRLFDSQTPKYLLLGPDPFYSSTGNEKTKAKNKTKQALFSFMAAVNMSDGYNCYGEK